MAKKYGYVEWSEPLNSKKSEGPKDEWLNLRDGDNMMRIVTKAHQYYSHKFKHASDTSKGFGDKIMCSVRDKGDPCPVCEQGNKPTRRWYVGAIDRVDNRYKIVDLSYTIMQALQSYNDNKKYGEPINYDINIKVNSEAGGAGYYTLVVDPPSPLTEEDRKTMASINHESLVRRCQPPTYTRALERLNFCMKRHELPEIVASAGGLALMERLAKMTDTATATTTAASSTSGRVQVSPGVVHTPVDLSTAQDFDFPAA